MWTIACTFAVDWRVVTACGKLDTSTTIVRGFAAATLWTRLSCDGSRPMFTRSTASRPSYVVGQVAHGVGFGSGGAVPQVGWLPTNTIAGPPAAAAAVAAAVAALPLLSAAYM